MPELPEVETVRRQLEPLLAGRRIVDAEAHPSPKFAPAVRAVAHRVGGVRRRGKYLLFDLLDGGDTPRELVVHLGMTGGLHVVDAPSPDPYRRARWELDDGRNLVFRDVRRFGRIAVVPAGDHRSLPTLHDLGPEPFDPVLDAGGFHARLAGSRRRVKTHLLSQRPIAGVGNIYADEALRGRSGMTTGANVDDVHLEGQFRLDCYGRAGSPCARCRTPLTSRPLDQRTATWCPSCQAR